jgi:hypothetical protein
MTHLLVDANNLFHRAKHVTQGDVDIKGGTALHIIFASINKIWKKFNGSHVVVALEGPNNWRRSAFETYKGHRRAAALQRSEREREEDEIYFEYMNEFVRFMSEHTNTSVISVPGCEADDVIARWIQLHPDTNHVIISSDTDFYQLIAPNVQIYNGITQETINIDGWFDDKDKPIINKKNKEVKEAVDPDWELFKKCMLGDKGDAIVRAAPPRIRETKLREAYEDRNKKGFAWNNLMLSAWVDHEGVELRVIDRFSRNVILVDLTKQPIKIIERLDEAIKEISNSPKKQNVGVWFMKFCHTYSLKRLEQNASTYVDFLNAEYNSV